MSTIHTTGSAWLAGAPHAERVFKENEQTALNTTINEKSEPQKQTEASERSKIARGIDYLAVIPLIGSLFGLARIIGSAAVAAYYKWHENTKSNSADMLLRAQDEAIRGLQELIPFGGLGLALEQLDQDGLKKTITPGAAGKFYCRHGEELYYGNVSLKGQSIQWIRTDQITPHTRIYKQAVAMFSVSVKRKDTVFARNQGRVIEQPSDRNGRVLTKVKTEDLEILEASIDWDK